MKESRPSIIEQELYSHGLNQSEPEANNPHAFRKEEGGRLNPITHSTKIQSMRPGLHLTGSFCLNCSGAMAFIQKCKIWRNCAVISAIKYGSEGEIIVC